MKKQHQTLIGAAALSLAVAGSLAGAVPVKADGPPVDCIECDFSPRVAALNGVMYKLNSIMSKHAPIFDKSTPLLNALDKIEIVLKW